MIDLEDNFETGINKNIWSLKRIEKNRYDIVQEEQTNRPSLAIVCKKGDMMEIGNDGKNTERSEISERYDVCIGMNTPIWYTFSVYFPTSFEINENRFVFAQWKLITEESKSPFLSFRYSNGILIFQIQYNEQRVKFKKEVDLRGNWHNIVVNYQLNDNQTGFAKVWINNELFAEYNGPLGYKYKENLIYFKMGIYRDEIDLVQSILISKFRRSSNKEFCLKP